MWLAREARQQDKDELMAHYAQLKFVETTAAHLAKSWQGRKILEIGSHDVNGSVRPYFSGSEYVGVDLSEGPGVDIVSSGHDLNLPEKSFDGSISCECFEHNPEWRETFQNMHRMTKDGGVVLVTCASHGRMEHGTSRSFPDRSPGTQSVGWNYYRNLYKSDFEKHFKLNEMFENYAFFTNTVSKDLYFVGIKPSGPVSVAPPAFHLDISALREALMAPNSYVTMEEPRVRSVGKAILHAPEKLVHGLVQLNLVPDKIYQDTARAAEKIAAGLKMGLKKTRDAG